MKLFKFKWKAMVQDEMLVAGVYAKEQKDAINFLELDVDELKTLKLVSVEDIMEPVEGSYEFFGTMEDYLMEASG